MAAEGAPPSRDQRTRELEVFAETSRLLTSTLDLGEVLDRLAVVARVRLEVEVVRIWLVDEGTGYLHLRAQTGTLRQDVAFLQRFAPTEGLAGWVLSEGAPLILSDVQTDPRLKNRDWFMAEGIASILAVPIVLDMMPIGIVACMTRARREFSPADLALATAVAAPAALAVRNARLYAEALDRLEEIQSFQRVTSETLSSPDLETALRTVVRETQHLLRSDGAFCSLVDPETLDVQTVVAVGARTTDFPRYRLAPGEDVAGLVVGEKRPFRTDDYLSDSRWVRDPSRDEWARAEGTRAAITAPVLDREGTIIALLWAFNRSPGAFNEAHEEKLVRLAQQAALAISKTRSFEEERRRAHETVALLEIARASTSTLELRPMLRELARQIARAFGVERCTINLWQGGQLVPVMAQFADGHIDARLWEKLKTLAQQGVQAVLAGAEAMRLKQPVVVEDAVASPLVSAEWVEAFGLRAVLVVPLISKDEVIGTLSLDDTKGPRPWSRAQVDLAMTIAAQLALAVDNARHFEEAQQRAVQVETLSRIGETLTSTLDLQAVLEAIADSAKALIGAQRAVVFELDPADARLRARAVRGIGIEPGLSLQMGQGAAGAAALQRAPVCSPDVLSEPPPGYDRVEEQSGIPLGELARQYGYRGILAVPVLSRETVLGAVCVYWDEVHAAAEREIRLLTALARQAAIAMENARLVTDLKRTLDDLKAAQDGLVRGATLRAVGELAQGAAHHLNNLMAVVLGRAQLLQLREPPAAMRESLKTIERAAQDAAETVRRIQAFSRTDKGPKAEPLDLNVLVREAVEFTRPRWEHEAQVRGAHIEVVLDSKPLRPVLGRSADMREVLTNLILNAVDAMPTGGRLAIATRQDGARVAVSVRDSGAGMAEEVKRRAFEPFFTTKGVKRTGLGLAVAYGTIRRYGGQIELESGEGQGATVTFWLPSGDREAGPAGVAPDARRRILVVDDEADVRDLLAEILDSLGFSVSVASGGREGLEKFRADRFDLVLTDLAMPDVTGWDVARAVKASRPKTLVLILTGWGETVEPPRGTSVDGVLTKPFDLERLAVTVTEALASPR